jgi:hypothetical protein
MVFKQYSVSGLILDAKTLVKRFVIWYCVSQVSLVLDLYSCALNFVGAMNQSCQLRNKRMIRVGHTNLSWCIFVSKWLVLGVSPMLRKRLQQQLVT